MDIPRLSDRQHFHDGSASVEQQERWKRLALGSLGSAESSLNMALAALEDAELKVAIAKAYFQHMEMQVARVWGGFEVHEKRMGGFLPLVLGASGRDISNPVERSCR